MNYLPTVLEPIPVAAIATGRWATDERGRVSTIAGRGSGVAGQRAETTVVQALPIFGRSWVPAVSQSSAIRSPRAKGQ